MRRAPRRLSSGTGRLTSAFTGEPCSMAPAETMSMTRREERPSCDFSMTAFSTTTAPVTSMTTRALPGAEVPPRNVLTRPTGVSPGSGGSCSFTSGSSTNTRFGLVSANTWNSTWCSRPMMNLVRVFSAGAPARGAAASDWPDMLPVTCCARDAEESAIVANKTPENDTPKLERRSLPMPIVVDPRLTHYSWRDSLVDKPWKDGIFQVFTGSSYELVNVNNFLLRSQSRPIAVIIPARFGQG